MNGTILLTVATVVGTTEAKALYAPGKNKQGKLTVRPVIAGFAMGVFLFAFDSINSDITTKLCVLIIISALLINGLPLLSIRLK